MPPPAALVISSSGVEEMRQPEKHLRKGSEALARLRVQAGPIHEFFVIRM